MLIRGCCFALLGLFYGENCGFEPQSKPQQVTGLLAASIVCASEACHHSVCVWLSYGVVVVINVVSAVPAAANYSSTGTS